MDSTFKSILKVIVSFVCLLLCILGADLAHNSIKDLDVKFLYEFIQLSNLSIILLSGWIFVRCLVKFVTHHEYYREGDLYIPHEFFLEVKRLEDYIQPLVDKHCDFKFVHRGQDKEHQYLVISHYPKGNDILVKEIEFKRSNK